MGCDIHPAIEYRDKYGEWHYHRPKAECPYYYEYAYEAGTSKIIYPTDEKGEKIRSRWDSCKYRLPEFFTNRDYNVFALLADVRNDGAIIPIQTGRGLPHDITQLARAQMSDEHTPGWVSLKELKEYDFKRPVPVEGWLDEPSFLALARGEEPKTWEDYNWGKKVVLEPTQYAKLYSSPIDLLTPGAKRFDDGKEYLIH